MGKKHNWKSKNPASQHISPLLQCFQMPSYMGVNPLPNEKMLDWSKASADSKLNVSQIVQFLFDRVDNIVEKGEK